MKATDKSLRKMQGAKSNNSMQNDVSSNRRTRPRPMSNVRNGSIGNSKSPQQSLPGGAILKDDNEGRSLLPIWALATANLIDHSTTATGVSSSSQWKVRQQRERNLNREKSSSGFVQVNPGQNRLSTIKADSNSNLHTNTEMNVNSSSNVPKKSLLGTNDNVRPQRRRSLETKTDSSTAYSRKNDQSGRRTKQWIRSGNKWIIGDDLAGNSAKGWRNRTGSASSASSMGPGANISSNSPSHINDSSPNRKVHPTAVSSYGASTANSTTNSGAKISPGRKYDLNSFMTPKQQPQQYDTASSISNFAASSASGLYTRRRMATTPGGFPYMPALHLLNKKSSNVVSGGGISNATGIDASVTTGASSALLGSQRFQHSYLLRSAPAAANIKTQQRVQFEENRRQQPLQKHNTHRTANVIESQRNQKSLFSDDEYTSSSYLYRSNSGYDSEGDCEQRLREWKEKFAPKINKEEGEHTSSTARIRRVRSLDSECDSEHNLVMDRLNEWKDEQYKSVYKLHAAKEGITKRRESMKETRSPPTIDRVASPQQQQYLRPQQQIPMPSSPVQIQSQESFSSDNGYDSGSNSYNERLKEWKKQQFRLSGSTKTGNAMEENARSPIAAQFRSHLQQPSSDPGYDSESSRNQRIQEWKDKFAFGLLPSPPNSNREVERFSSSQAESGALETRSPGLQTIHSSAKSASRRGRKIPGGGIFPVTSPSRKQKDTLQFQSPNQRGSAFADQLSPENSSRSRPLPPLTPPRIANLGIFDLDGKESSQNASTPKRANGTGTTNAFGCGTPTLGTQSENDDTHVVLKATNFLLGLGPSSEYFDAQNDEALAESSTDCFMSSLGINSPCKVIPSLTYVPSTESAEYDDPISPPIGKEFSASSLQLPKALNLWKNYNDTSVEPSDSFQSWKSQINLHSWDNCLVVRAEGARSGRICLTTTHLIFIYEDDISDSLLARYGWSRNHVDDFLIEMEGPSSRGATPVNVPLDESGEGGGVELIESDGKRVTIMDLLENGFENADCIHSDVACNGEQKLDQHEKEKCSDGDDANMDGSHVSSSGNQSSLGSSLAESVKLNNSIVVPKSESKNKHVHRGERHSGNAQFLDDIAPISLSSSSFDSGTELDDGNNVEHDVHHTNDSGFCRNDSNEDVMSNCIIRAINEEAHMRILQEDERTSYSVFDKNRSERLDNGDPDYTSLYGNQTNVSSFSDVDMDIDPDQERSLYISDEDFKRRYIGIKWPLNKLSEVFDRRYMMKEVGLEIFGPSPSQLTTSSLRQTSSTSVSTTEIGCEIDVPLGPLSHFSLYLVIPGIEGRSISRFRRKKIPRRETFVEALKDHASQLNDANWQGSPRMQRKWQWRRNEKNDPLSALTRAWRKGHISNYDYLLRLNAIAGRSFHDPGNYPIMPWVLSNFTSTSVPDLSDERNYRDLSKPMGALDPDRLLKFQDKYASLCTMIDTAIPPFMYGSHYSSTGGVVLHYLVRVRPFAGLHRQLQGGQFDLPDRLFRSVSLTWDHCSRTSPTEVKELTPEWYSDGSFLKNKHDFNLGTSAADGAAVSDVILPPWAENDETKFIEVMRNALESDYCSTHLHSWIDLIFGCKMRGPEAEKSNNLFYHLSYYDSDDLANIKDDGLRTEIELHIADFGSCPTQLFLQPHPIKKMDRKGELQLQMNSNGQQLSDNDNSVTSATFDLRRRNFF